MLNSRCQNPPCRNIDVTGVSQAGIMSSAGASWFSAHSTDGITPKA